MNCAVLLVRMGPVQKDVVVRCHGRGKCSITFGILCLLSPWAVTFLSTSQFIFGVTFKERHIGYGVECFLQYPLHLDCG